ncbi:triacylglycerol lipase [Nocardioides sp.]|uniref:esterase/lipase family protein n=1 Tax=Nocardioides sp. TaxID=35761 RepID=UPI0027237D4B|nr:alpha/beta fold hydrolase [Nocardioides sp.]MDO9456211.1 alpha/beta fold hydrolase [Nocardioides sp.]
MRHTLGPLVVVLLLAAGLTATAPAPATALPTLPTSPLGDPPGANDWSCRPTASHPTPVVLVHGTGGDRTNLLQRLSAGIKAAGFCVYSLDYGNRGLDDIAASAGELKTFTQRVLRSTGARKVSMVGHSQGGMMPRYYIKFLGGDSVIDDLVGLSPSNHGTRITAGDNAFTRLVGFACTSCVQQGAGSPFLTRLNAGDETPGAVSYTQVTTRYDEVVVPHTSGYLAAGPRTTNITLQSKCPLELTEHLGTPLATPSLSITLDALTHVGPARPAFQPRCL